LEPVTKPEPSGSTTPEVSTPVSPNTALTIPGLYWGSVNTQLTLRSSTSCLISAIRPGLGLDASEIEIDPAAIMPKRFSKYW